MVMNESDEEKENVKKTDNFEIQVFPNQLCHLGIVFIDTDSIS